MDEVKVERRFPGAGKRRLCSRRRNANGMAGGKTSGAADESAKDKSKIPLSSFRYPVLSGAHMCICTHSLDSIKGRPSHLRPASTNMMGYCTAGHQWVLPEL